MGGSANKLFLRAASINLNVGNFARDRVLFFPTPIESNVSHPILLWESESEYWVFIRNFNGIWDFELPSWQFEYAVCSKPTFWKLIYKKGSIRLNNNSSMVLCLPVTSGCNVCSSRNSSSKLCNSNYQKTILVTEDSRGFHNPFIL